ncbi:MAG: hypothetical protein JST00_02085 [Deltaproteobacteria bacterium]|nr:hypothetical protein [Deltaproteobacteria bacterium]
MTSLLWAAVLVTCLLVPTNTAWAETAPPANRAVFAIVVGSNASVDTELAPLKYADDDAARWVDLFRLLGARTYLLTRPDANTARLHVQAAAEARPPVASELEQAVRQVASDVAQARGRGVETDFYFLYAGHGSVRNGEGYITLEDARLTGPDLAKNVVSRIGADRIHFVIDACDSFLVAYPRGPGGERRPIKTLGNAPGLGDDPRVGLLLSSSSHRESHEWDAFQAGVFSHEVRSGMYGAADADGDGRITYREIAAFVARANSAVPNERFRPQVYARAPAGVQALLEIGHRLDRHVEIDGKHAGHYIVEDARGVRVAETHTSAGARIRLLRPAPNGHEYLRRLDDDTEYLLPSEKPVVVVADLAPETPRVHARGAAHEAFELVFAMPFDEGVVSAWVEPPLPPEPPSVDTEPAPDPRARAVRRTLGWTALGVGAAGLAVGTGFSIASIAESGASTPAESQRDAALRNERIERERTIATVGWIAGGTLAATGLVLLLWPGAPSGVRATASAHGGQLGFGGSF